MSEVEVLATTAMKTVFDELTPQFHEETGHCLNTRFGPSAQIEKRLVDGEAADVAILTVTVARNMIARGKVVAGSPVDIASSSLGVAVRSGMPKPDISSVGAFKDALLGARSIAVSKPVGAGLSGAHMAKVFAELGIAAAMAAKAKYGTGGISGLVGLIVERGEADIGIQQMAELMAVPGINIVGPLPPELQSVTLFAAAIPTSARNPEAGRKLIGFLTTSGAKRIIKAKGLEPA
ncbi:MAG: molybdate ABC transporter substrate-binding protein [Pseudomonadota bacterium]